MSITSTVTLAAADLQAENVFDQVRGLGGDVKSTALFFVGVVIGVLALVKLVQTRGSFGPVIGLLIGGAVIYYFVAHQDKTAGDVGDTLNGAPSIVQVFDVGHSPKQL